jgi:hypothetical protein
VQYARLSRKNNILKEKQWLPGARGHKLNMQRRQSAPKKLNIMNLTFYKNENTLFCSRKIDVFHHNAADSQSPRSLRTYFSQKKRTTSY